MKSKNFIIFDADLPDDGSYSAGGDIVTPSGLNVALLIQKKLAQAGMQASNPAQHRFYGWSMSIKTSQGVFSLLLQHPGPWLLICTRRGNLLRSLIFGDKDRALFCDSLIKCLNEMPDLKNVNSFTQTEFENAQRAGRTK